MSDLTPDQLATLIASERVTSIVTALIGKRVTATTVLNGTSKGSAAALVADAMLIMAELGKVGA